MNPPKNYTDIDHDFSQAVLDMMIQGKSMAPDYRFLIAMQEELDGLVRRFERTVWLGGLRAITKDAERDGDVWKLKCKDRICATFWSNLGRSIVQLESDTAVIQFAFDPELDSPSGGITRSNGTLDDLQALVSQVCTEGKQGKGFRKKAR